MRKFFTVLMCALALVLCPFGVQAQQTVSRQGNTFVSTSTRSSASSAKETKYTWKSPKGEEYKIFITKNGRCFVNKVSGKTGKEYKYYLPEEISKTVAKEMGITYVPKQTKK